MIHRQERCQLKKKTIALRLALLFGGTALISLLISGNATAKGSLNLNSKGPGIDALSGKLIIINPGHGRIHGDDYYPFDRQVISSAGKTGDVITACADIPPGQFREDCLMYDMALELKDKFYASDETDTMDVQLTRALPSFNNGNNFMNPDYHRETHPWIEMNTYEYLKYRSQNEPELEKCLYDHIIKDGLDGSVADDIAARSCYANRLIEAAGFPENVTVSLHSDYQTDNRSGTQIIYSAPFNPHSGESRILATKVHDCMQKYLDPDNTHAWNVLDIQQSDDGYGEVDYVNGPAILVELGNSENAVDFAQMNSGNFRSMALESIRAAVDEFFGGPVCKYSSISPTPFPTGTSTPSLTPTVSPTRTTTNTRTPTTDPY
jgi:N-acetylmuramoyl-L-alanine amidase